MIVSIENVDLKSPYTFPIDSFGVIERWDIYLAPFYEPVIREHNSSNGCHEDRVRGHEVEESLCPPADEHCEENSSSNVEVFWQQRRYV
jgi:hypothetical protein